jgi:hypothetical protein
MPMQPNPIGRTDSSEWPSVSRAYMVVLAVGGSERIQLIVGGVVGGSGNA